jgi:beta-mannanase
MIGLWRARRLSSDAVIAGSGCSGGDSWANGASADKYLAAYRRVHDAFVKEGAANVVWVWCPNVTDEPRASWNQALNYYPGDDYVDWTCVDGYNWGSSNGGNWQSFRDVFKTIYPTLASKGKPIMIGEMASAEVGGDKAAWIAQIVPTLRDDFPLIKALVWFDVNKETDWRISSSPEAEAAFVRMANDAYFNP